MRPAGSGLLAGPLIGLKDITGYQRVIYKPNKSELYRPIVSKLSTKMGVIAHGADYEALG